MKKTGKTKRMPIAQAAMPAMILPRREPRLRAACAGLLSLSGELAGGGSECAGHQDSSNRVDTVRSRKVAMAIEKITTTTPCAEARP